MTICDVARRIASISHPLPDRDGDHPYFIPSFAMLNRLSLFLSLIGMVLSLHLWIQKERNFDDGCWGASILATPSPAAGGCNDEELKKYSEFLGVSVAAWGYAFYFLSGLLAFGRILFPEDWARRCHTAAEMTVALAFPFSIYLVYVQAFVTKSFCPLCLISSGLVTSLFIIHAYQYWKGGFKPLPESGRVKEIGYASGMAFGAMGILAALMIMVNQIGTRRLDRGENARQFEGMLEQALPKHIEPRRLLEMKPALYNPDLALLDSREWLTGELPPLGKGSGLPVVVFLDPNCPSCKHTYAAIKLLAERFADRAQFHVFSRTLWAHSELQSQALELAARYGKYHEMWQLQFDRARKGGMNFVDIEKLFTELGLETGDLEKRLAGAKPDVMARRNRAITAGIRGTPTIFINGRAVANGSTDLVSLTKLIEQAAGPEQHNQSSK